MLKLILKAGNLVPIQQALRYGLLTLIPTVSPVSTTMAIKSGFPDKRKIYFRGRTCG